MIEDAKTRFCRRLKATRKAQKMTLEKLFKHLQYSINEDELKAWEALIRIWAMK